MNKFLFGRGWVFSDETNGEGDGNGSGGGAAPAGDGAGSGDGTGEDLDAGGEGGGEGGDQGGEKKEEAPKDMKAAIDAALGYKKDAEGNRLDADGKITHDKDGKPVAPVQAADKKPATGKETDTLHANGKPKKNEKGEALDADGKVVQKMAPKVKTSAELALTQDERKALGTKAQIRFGEVINTLKAHEGTIAQQGESIKVLTESRDAILGVMQETKTTPDQLSGYLEFNALLQSDKAADLESALEMVEKQRTALYAKLGREPEGGGVDLLKDFPDLAKQVEEEEITRAAALEIAHNRREKAAQQQAKQRQEQQQRQQTQTTAQQQQARENALKGIEAWTAELSKSDLDYKAKEDKLLGETLEGVLKEYPPNLWLPTLKKLYAGITVQKAAPAAGRQHQPLRPSGAKPGAKAPTSMQEAIDQGLGYAGAAKG